MNKKIKTLILISSFVILLSFSSVFAYFYLKEDKNINAPIGLVEVNPIIYHEENNVISDAIFYKPGVYLLNVSNMAESNHIDKFRVDFEVNSNVETYIRVKHFDNLTLIYESADGSLIEVSSVSEDIKYSIDEKWFYNKDDGYYYYMEKVVKKDDEETLINFIVEGLNYEQKSPHYLIQFSMKMEAVQAYRGPKENWNLDKMPWEV